jgi:acyl-coenzyme A thioesterase PaaI-like protein
MADSEQSSDLEHFQSIPWCAALLSSPGYRLTKTPSRTLMPYGESSLFGQTLKTENTITHIQSMYLRTLSARVQPLITEVRTLVTLSTGMNGSPNTLHGGMIVTLMDDTIGTLMKLNHAAEGLPQSVFGLTAKMDVRFSKMVATPGTYCIGASCTKVEGKKVRLRGWVRDEEDDVCASAESTWIIVDWGDLQTKL